MPLSRIVPFFWMLVVWLVLCSSVSRAVEITEGGTYAGGTTLTSSEAGVTTSVPSGWQAGLPAGASALILQRDDQSATILVATEETTSARALAEMAETVDLGDGLIFVPTGAPTRGALGILEGHYKVSSGSQAGVGAIYTRIGPAGVAVAYFAIDMDGGSGARDAAKRLASEAQFAAPKPISLVSSEGSEAWSDYMRGRYIARFDSGSGYHEKTEVWLCRDGSFRTRRDAGSYGGAASGAFADGSAGRWSATGSQPGVGELVLNFQDGPERYSLSIEGGSLRVDGSKWLRGENELCP